MCLLKLVGYWLIFEMRYQAPLILLNREHWRN